jgi:hypothetical protein
VNDPPTADDQSVTTAEDTPLPITLTGSDIDGDPLTYIVVTQPQHGTLSGGGADWTYTPEADYNGPDGFTFKVNDGTVDSNVATVSITVTPVNDPPVAYDQSVTTPEDTPLPITLTGSDVDGDPLAYIVVTQPQHGTLSGSGADWTYTPEANYNGPDGFTFKVNDGTVDSNVATVSITVTPVNDPPNCTQAYPSAVMLWPPNHKMKAISVLGVIDDVEGDPVTVTVTGVRQDEPVNGLGDGDTSPDATLAPPQLRVERAGGGDGRVYHIEFVGQDSGGASCAGTLAVCVPHDQGQGPNCVDGGALYDSTQP